MMRDEAGPVRLKTRGKNRKSIIRMRIIIAANRKGKRLFQQQLQKSSAQTVPPSAQQKRGGPFASDGFFGIAAALGDFANALLRLFPSFSDAFPDFLSAFLILFIPTFHLFGSKRIDRADTIVI